MLERKTRYVDELDIRSYIKEYHRQDIKELSGEEVVSFIFGDIHESGRFTIVDKFWRPKEKWYHRLNRFWAYPLFVLCMPYQYVVHGETGWDDKTKFGNWILRVTGHRD